jgi:CheY-like chemotaxis protein
VYGEARLYNGVKACEFFFHWLSEDCCQQIMTTSSRKTILIVDDHREIREVMAELLGINGYRVADAANGREALKWLEAQEPPCLILLDLMMPVMNGWEFLNELRSREELAKLPVVIVSAYEDRAPRDQVQAVIKKPIEFPRLLRQVEIYCG